MKLPPILASGNADALARALAGYARTATVEAEYGDRVVEGSVATLAHHGPRAGNPSPCMYAGPHVAVDAIGVSHIDLDAIGGILALVGRRPGPSAFWRVAAAVDVAGPHRLEEILHAETHERMPCGAGSALGRQMRAWWAWSKANRLPPLPKDDAVDIAPDVRKAVAALARILDYDPAMLACGDRFADDEHRLNVTSARSEYRQGGIVVLVRSRGAAGSFVSHLYRSVGGKVANAIIAHDPREAPPGGALMLSFEGDAARFGLSAAEIMREVFGPLAGGHAGIAGSPRGEPRSETAADHLAELVLSRLVKASEVVAAGLAP